MSTRVAKPPVLWKTVRMTNQQRTPQYREDHKVQKLIERIETKLALQAKAVREATQASAKN
jgi:deoxyhypusine synthase